MFDSITRNLFISYAREDRPIAESLHAFLRPLIAQGKLLTFIDTEEIEKGEEWHKKITNQLHRADAFLFLVSQHYFRSNYIIENELPAMIKRYREEQVECWPFLVSDYPWDDFVIDGFNLAGIQAIGPYDGNKRLIPLNALPVHDQESQLRSVYTEVRDWIEKLEREKRQKQDTQTRQLEQKEREEQHRVKLEEEQRKHQESQQSERKQREQEKQASAIKSDSRQDDAHISELSSVMPGSAKAISAFLLKYFWLVLIGLVIAVTFFLRMDDKEQKHQPELGSFRDALSSGGKGPEMVQIPAGSFMMGSTNAEPGRNGDEGPQREVQIRPFAMGKTEVTFDDYDRFADATGRERPSDEGWGRGSRPVINVSWQDALDYAAWLRGETGKRYRLPSEAEWEYAARAGTITAYPWGDQASHDHANYGTNNCCEGLAEGADKWIYTAPVGQFTPNEWQLHDMSGNVWEWVQDCYAESYERAPRYGTPLEENGICETRVLRGGSWNVGPQGVRSALRGRIAPDNRDNYVGFRLARTN